MNYTLRYEFFHIQGLKMLTNEIDQFNLSYVIIGGEKDHIRNTAENMGMIYEKILQVIQIVCKWQMKIWRMLSSNQNMFSVVLSWENKHKKIVAVRSFCFSDLKKILIKFCANWQ